MNIKIVQRQDEQVVGRSSVNMKLSVLPENYPKVLKVKQTDRSYRSTLPANRLQQPMKSIKRFAGTPSSKRRPSRFQCTWIMLPWLDRGWKVMRSPPSRFFKMVGRVWTSPLAGFFRVEVRPAGERFVTQKSAERRKPKSPHHSWERAKKKKRQWNSRRRKKKHTKTK